MRRSDPRAADRISIAAMADAIEARPMTEARRRYVAGRRISLGQSISGQAENPIHDAPSAPPNHDALVDTRELLMELYQEAAPWQARIKWRAKALSFHLRKSLRDAKRTKGFAKDMCYLFTAWFLIAALMRYKPDGSEYDDKNDNDVPDTVASGSVFYVIFELASAYGNVGLSLGSVEDPYSPASFSRDLRANPALWVMMVVMILGRTREMPGRIDCALTMPTVGCDDVLRASHAMEAPANLAPGDAAAAAAGGDEEKGDS